MSGATALEPDAGPAAGIEPPSGRHRTIAGAIACLNGRFDRAKLTRDGTPIVLSPARPFLYTPLDGAIGHCRREG